MALTREQQLEANNGWEVFNPYDKPLDELPIIFVFVNGHALGGPIGVALSENGHDLGSHACSSEGYVPGDLGARPGFRKDRHTNQYQTHYPDGYRMEYVPSQQIDEHKKLQAAFKEAEKVYEANKDKEKTDA
jgi:hypothetical protein